VINHLPHKISLRMEGGRHHNRRKQTSQKKSLKDEKNKTSVTLILSAVGKDATNSRKH
jgi:hypothetical protein